ncbi:MAG: hypothetical protein ACKVQQ_06405 [Burkholderiales bacterium]
MLKYEAQGETRVAIAASQGTLLVQAAAILATCTLPIIVHDHARAGILGSATLLQGDDGPVLLTAAHLFDSGVRLGNLLLPTLLNHSMVPLCGARLTRCAGADIALLHLKNGAESRALVAGRSMIPALRRRAGRRARLHLGRGTALVSGFPSAMTRFERGWLAARRFTVLTHATVAGPGACREDHWLEFGRTAWRDDGTAVHTPEMEGMSGAGIWIVEQGASALCLRLCAVQSAYMHGRYLRGHDIGAGAELLGA